eukprot:124003-Chlamydomonas_euryale.AAC.2
MHGRSQEPFGDCHQPIPCQIAWASPRVAAEGTGMVVSCRACYPRSIAKLSGCLPYLPAALGSCTALGSPRAPTDLGLAEWQSPFGLGPRPQPLRHAAHKGSSPTEALRRGAAGAATCCASAAAAAAAAAARAAAAAAAAAASTIEGCLPTACRKPPLCSRPLQRSCPGSPAPRSPRRSRPIPHSAETSWKSFLKLLYRSSPPFDAPAAQASR